MVEASTQQLCELWALSCGTCTFSPRRVCSFSKLEASTQQLLSFSKTLHSSYSMLEASTQQLLSFSKTLHNPWECSVAGHAILKAQSVYTAAFECSKRLHSSFWVSQRLYTAAIHENAALLDVQFSKRLHSSFLMPEVSTQQHVYVWARTHTRALSYDYDFCLSIRTMTKPNSRLKAQSVYTAAFQSSKRLHSSFWVSQAQHI